MCDRLHNISDNPTEKMVTDTSELLDHLMKNRKLSKTHKEIIGAIHAEIVKFSLK